MNLTPLFKLEPVFEAMTVFSIPAPLPPGITASVPAESKTFSTGSTTISVGKVAAGQGKPGATFALQQPVQVRTLLLLKGFVHFEKGSMKFYFGVVVLVRKGKNAACQKTFTSGRNLFVF